MVWCGVALRQVTIQHHTPHHTARQAYVRTWSLRWASSMASSTTQSASSRACASPDSASCSPDVTRYDMIDGSMM